MKLSALLLISLLSALSISVLSAVSVFAQDSMNFDLQNYLGDWFNVESLVKFIFPNFPDEWLRVPQVIWYVIVPFITAFTVLYGLLIELRIFRNMPKVNTMLAFCMAFLLLPSGMLTWIVTIFYAGGAFIGVMGFIFVFIAGVFIWGYGTSWRFWGTYGSARGIARDVHGINRQISDISKQIIDLDIKIKNENSADKRAKLLNERDNLYTKQADLRAQMAERHKHLRDLSA